MSDPIPLPTPEPAGDPFAGLDPFDLELIDSATLGIRLRGMSLQELGVARWDEEVDDSEGEREARKAA